MRNSFLALVLVSIVAASARAQGAAAPPTHIGTAAAVHGLVKAAAPGAIGRVVESGKPLFLNDHVTTDAAGRLQILLADETVFTIGPNADMVLDKFVYDPSTGQGSVAAQIVRGAFRFVTGRIARRQPESMKVRLNVGVIGIRGTVVVGETGSQGSTVINAGAGPSNDANEPPSAITVTNGGATVNISHTGEGTRFTNNGAPSNPAPMGDELDRISNVLGSKPSSKQASRGVLGGSARDRSGHSTSKGQDYASLDADFNALAGNANGIQSNVSQFDLGGSIPDGTSDWSQFARLSGSGVYNGSGIYTCAGITCVGPSQPFNFNFTANFDLKAVTGGTIALTVGGGTNPLSANDTINNTPFGTSGQAVLTVNNSSAFYNGTTLTFANSGGIAAKNVTLTLQYNDVSNTATGTASGGR